MREGRIIQELIGLWVEYAESRPDQSIKSFAKWLNNKMNPAEEPDTSDMPAKKMELGKVFGRLINFTELWAKLAFKDLPIRHFEDYGILNGVKYMPNPSKNELANLLLDQKSTAFEIMKRLQRDGLLEEEVEKADKRMKRVRLTKYGDEVLQQAQQQASKVSDLLMGDLNDKEVVGILEKFKELDKFHSAKYDQGNFDSIDDLLD
ncbi:MAG: MarR family winged helix-turn-helix transcriptional regulator [Bacteroidota bacterium]